MPLDRAHMTVAQRVMTIVNTAFSAVLGYAYVFQADQLRASPAYAGADRILPLGWWGLGFVGIAVFLGAGLVTRRRSVHVAGLAWLLVWQLVWAGVFIAVFFRGEASFIAWIWPAYVAAACWASMLTLIARET